VPSEIATGEKGDMADHAAVRFRDQRNRQRLRRAQCRDDELLGVVADFQGPERSDG
jgi:hypothetical protein